MRPIGFSTGALAYGDFRQGLAALRDKNTTTVELSALREKELAPLVDALDSLDLQNYTYISVHAPSKFDKEHETEIVALLRAVVSRGWPIVLHPDAIRDVALWNSFGRFLLIENMDKRNICGRTQQELSEIFRSLPEAGLCFDIGHCRQVDPTMNEAYLILRTFGDRLRQLHVSEVNSRSTHDPLSNAAVDAFRVVSSLIPENIPVILESPVGEKDISREVELARLALPVLGAGRTNARAASLQSAIA
jgi:Xylose isomerase-like TIM barrel